MEPFIGEVILFAGNFEPRGWMYCDGQLLPIAQFSALYSILGTAYGGDGQTTFALPDLRGRVPLGPRHGPGLSPHLLGASGGQETVTLTANQMPSHHHTQFAALTLATSPDPTGNMLAVETDPAYAPSGPAAAMGVQAIGSAGGSQSHQNLQPYLALNYIIAIEGIYPSRS